MQLTALPIRIPCDAAGRNLAYDAWTGQPPVIYAGNSALIACALFRRDQLVDEVDNLSTARMVLRDRDAQGAVLGAWETTAFAEITLAQWEQGDGQFAFAVDSGETLIPLPDSGERACYFAIEVTTAATAPITVATGKLILREDGIGAESMPTPPPVASFRISGSGHLELHNPDEEAWFTVTLSGVPTGINFTPSA